MTLVPRTGLLGLTHGFTYQSTVRSLSPKHSLECRTLVTQPGPAQRSHGKCRIPLLWAISRGFSFERPHAVRNYRLSRHRNDAKYGSLLKSPSYCQSSVHVCECKCLCSVLTLRYAHFLAGIVLPLTLLPTFNLLMPHSNANSATKSSGQLISSSSDTSLLPRLALASNFPVSY